jgi:formylglycine-generating enzyme required for sulfatase activity
MLPLEVARHKPNDFGLFDVLGNAAEWCQDRYVNDLTRATGSLREASEIVGGAPQRVVRGGSFRDPAASQRSAARWQFPAGQSADYIGFRVARSYP